jgi:hypothetical protein
MGMPEGEVPTRRTFTLTRSSDSSTIAEIAIAPNVAATAVLVLSLLASTVASAT